MMVRGGGSGSSDSVRVRGSASVMVRGGGSASVMVRGGGGGSSDGRSVEVVFAKAVGRETFPGRDITGGAVAGETENPQLQCMPSSNM